MYSRHFATSIEKASRHRQFAIDAGTLLGSPFCAFCHYLQLAEFYEIWKLWVQYQHRNLYYQSEYCGGGNDFALDDIFFGPICKDSMDFTVYVSEMQVESPSMVSSIVPLQRHSWK